MRGAKRHQSNPESAQSTAGCGQAPPWTTVRAQVPGKFSPAALAALPAAPRRGAPPSLSMSFCLYLTPMIDRRSCCQPPCLQGKSASRFCPITWSLDGELLGSRTVALHLMVSVVSARPWYEACEWNGGESLDRGHWMLSAELLWS